MSNSQEILFKILELNNKAEDFKRKLLHADKCFTFACEEGSVENMETHRLEMHTLIDMLLDNTVEIERVKKELQDSVRKSLGF